MFNIGEDTTHMAVVSFAGNAKVKAKLDSPAAHSKEGMMKLLDRMKKEKLSQPTRTDKALELVFNNVLTSANGDRPNSPDVIVVFTDGGLHYTAKPYSEVIPQVSEILKTRCTGSSSVNDVYFGRLGEFYTPWRTRSCSQSGFGLRFNIFWI